MTFNVVGIDPGRTTGFAVWDRRAKKLATVTSMATHAAMAEVKRLHDAGELHSVVFEDARQRTWFGAMDAKVAKYGHAVREGAGAAKREATLWADYLKSLGVTVVAQKPLKGGTKWSAAYFKRVTGWAERTNEHGRDAACLVLGK